MIIYYDVLYHKINKISMNFYFNKIIILDRKVNKNLFKIYQALILTNIALEVKIIVCNY